MNGKRGELKSHVMVLARATHNGYFVSDKAPGLSAVAGAEWLAHKLDTTVEL